MHFRVPTVLLIGLGAVLYIAGAFAQTADTGALAGTVSDPSGAVIAGARATVLNVATGVTRSGDTNSSGLYTISVLPPGRYNAVFSASAFKTLSMPNIVVSVAETHTLNVVLPVGQQSEKVEVQANVAAIQTETTTLGGLVDENTVKNLPLTTRNYTQILGLSPGVISDVTNAGQLGKNTADVFVHGMRTLYNNYQMDGTDVNNFASGRGGEFLGYTGIAIPNPDAIEEFKVQTSLYDAGYGKAVGANVDVVTRSGGNAYHGNIFEFLRNDIFNANDFFLNRNSKPRPVLKQNQVGGTLGGHIIREKLFFFASYQGTRQRNGIGDRSLQSAILPPLTNDRSAARLGSQFCGQAGAFGGTPVACDGSNINPVALALLNVKLPNGSYFIPTPQTIRPDGLGFSVFSIPSSFTEDQVVANVDYQVSTKHRISWRSFYARDPEVLAFTASNVPGSGATALLQNRVGTLKVTSVLTPNLLNVATAAVTRNLGNLQSLVPVKSAAIGMTPGSDQTIIPTIAVAGLFNIGGNFNDNLDSAVNNYQANDALSWHHGRHNMRAGFGFQRIQDNFDIPGVKRGALQFQSFPDFLLGMSGAENGTSFSNVFFSFGLGGITRRDWRVANYASFLQDDFKVWPRLTLNLGLRWEILGLVSDAHGILANFWPDLASNNLPPDGTLQGFIVPKNFSVQKFPLPQGVATNSNKTVLASGAPLTNVGPRIGFAWQPLARTTRLAVRAGYGIFYAQTSGDHFAELIIDPPFFSAFIGQGVSNANATFQVPFNPGPQPIPLWTPRTATSDLTIATFDKHYNAPMAQQYNLNFQYELWPDYVLELGYVGVHGTRIVRGRQINQPSLASPGHPVNGITDNTVENALQRVPILGFDPIGLDQRETFGTSLYNGLETSLTKRFGHGIQFQVAYTWSKALDETMGTTGFGAAFTGTYTGDVHNPRQMLGPSEFDRRHRFVASYVFELPWFRTRRGFPGTVLGGWSVSGVTTIQSGSSLTLLDVRSGSIYGFSDQRAQLCPGFTNAQIPTSGAVDQRLTNYFNVSAFCAPPVIGNGFDFGTLSRGVVRGPNQANSDIALTKSFKLPGWGDATNLQFRAEFFNAFNTPQFANPGIDVSNPDFGQITSTSVASRIIQFALKYNF